MLLTLEMFEAMPNGEIFRIVTTKIQNVHEPLKAELTFICKKADSGHDWAIYGHFSDKEISFIASQGDKVFTEREIRDICPCTDDVYAKYRM